jgi:hypothetical protein
MPSPPAQQNPIDPAERNDDLDEDSDDYDAEFDVWLL